jgi:hypothetical protein
MFNDHNSNPFFVWTIDCGCSKLIDCSLGNCVLLPLYCYCIYSEQMYSAVCDRIKSICLSLLLFLLSERKIEETHLLLDRFNCVGTTNIVLVHV